MIDVLRALAPPAWCWTAGPQHHALPSPFAPALHTQALVKRMSKASSCPSIDYPALWLCGTDTTQEHEAGTVFDSGDRDGHTGAFLLPVGLCSTLAK